MCLELLEFICLLTSHSNFVRVHVIYLLKKIVHHRAMSLPKDVGRVTGSFSYQNTPKPVGNGVLPNVSERVMILPGGHVLNVCISKFRAVKSVYRDTRARNSNR